MCDRRAWLRWKGRSERPRDTERSLLAMAMGTAAESAIRRHLSDHRGHLLVDGDVVGMLRYESGDRSMTGHIDALKMAAALDECWLSEIKTTNDVGRYRRVARALTDGLVEPGLDLYLRQMRRYAAMLSLTDADRLPVPVVHHDVGWLAVYSVGSRQLVFEQVRLFDPWESPADFLDAELERVFGEEPDVPFDRYHPLCQTCPLFDHCYDEYDEAEADERHAAWGRRWREADEHEKFGRAEKASLREEMLPEFDRLGARSFALSDEYRASIKTVGDRWRYDRAGMERDGVLEQYATKTTGLGREVMVRRTEAS